jgi:ABC-2 type transport system permease protein
MLPKGAEQAFTRMLDDLAAWLPGADSLLWWPARAVLGEPLPVLAVAVLSVALFVLTTYALANRLMANAVAANGAAAKTVKTRSSGMLNADRGPIAVMRSKEWLLIARDPWLMTEIAKQVVIMLPGMLVLWHTSGSAYVWLGLALLAGQLAGSLTWLTVSTEDAADLLTTAPVRRADLNWAKLQAALIPCAVFMAAPLAVVFMTGLTVGFTVLVCSIGTAVSVGLYHLRHGVPAKRSQIGRRGDKAQMHALYELAIGILWVVPGLVALLLGWWGVLALLLAAPALVWIVR